jgi:hypothetical protein
MDPKKLAELDEERRAKKAAVAAAQQAELSAQQVAFQRRVEQGRVALRDVVIPDGVYAPRNCGAWPGVEY